MTKPAQEKSAQCSGPPGACLISKPPGHGTHHFPGGVPQGFLNSTTRYDSWMTCRKRRSSLGPPGTSTALQVAAAEMAVVSGERSSCDSGPLFLMLSYRAASVSSARKGAAKA